MLPRLLQYGRQSSRTSKLAIVQLIHLREKYQACHWQRHNFEQNWTVEREKRGESHGGQCLVPTCLLPPCSLPPSPSSSSSSPPSAAFPVVVTGRRGVKHAAATHSVIQSIVFPLAHYCVVPHQGSFTLLLLWRRSVGRAFFSCFGRHSETWFVWKGDSCFF